MEILGSVPPDHGRTAPRAPMTYEGAWRFTAPALDSSVPQARHAVRDLLLHQRVPTGGDLLPNLLLIVSELVTNAVRHAALLSPQIAIEVSIGPDWVRVAVEDNHPYRPTPLAADHCGTGGRGLLLVQAITSEAGGVYDVEHTAGGGKAVWAALPLVPGRSAAAHTAPGVAATPVAPVTPATPVAPAAPVTPVAPVVAPVTNPRRAR